MKKIVALFMTVVFALTLGVAFAEEKTPASSGTTPTTTEKAPAKSNKAKKAKHVKKHKKEAAAPTAAPATK